MLHDQWMGKGTYSFDEGDKKRERERRKVLLKVTQMGLYPETPLIF